MGVPDSTWYENELRSVKERLGWAVERGEDLARKLDSAQQALKAEMEVSNARKQQVENLEECWDYAQKVYENFLRDLFPGEEDKTWSAGCTSRKIVEMIRAKIDSMNLQVRELTAALEKMIEHDDCADQCATAPECQAILDVHRNLRIRYAEKPNEESPFPTSQQLKVHRAAKEFLDGDAEKRLCSSGQCKLEVGHDGDHIVNLIRRKSPLSDLGL